jgi:DtxR family Mn-dependent transcriptional regulator
MEGDLVIGARLAEKFRVSRPTAFETIRRLMADGYVVQNDDKSVALTAQGQAVTEGILRRHRLAERMLFDLLGMDWISAHEQAHTLEHGMTEELAAHISERLGHPLTCPHGNPIPGNAPSGMAFLREQHAFRLSDAQPGGTVRVVLISEVVEDETEILRRLSDKGLHPRSPVAVLENDPAEGVRFETNGKTDSLPPDLASKIWVADWDQKEKTTTT